MTDLVPHYSTYQNAASVKESLLVPVKILDLVLREVWGCTVPSGPDTAAKP